MFCLGGSVYALYFQSRIAFAININSLFRFSLHQIPIAFIQPIRNSVVARKV